MLKLLDENEPADETGIRESHEVQDKIMTVLNTELNSMKGDLAKHLKALGGREQLLMFLTGPAGAGKSTADKVAEVFCQQFCEVANVPWMDTAYLYTAYTGSVAALFGDIIIYKKAEMKGGQTKPLPSSF